MAIETHSDWITGSYTTDIQYVLEVAENNALRTSATLANLGPKTDSVGSVFIGYGYDLLQNAAAAAQALENAGATISDANGLTDLLESLQAPVSPDDLKQIAGYISVSNTAAAISSFATSLLQSTISNVESKLTAFLENNGVGVIPASNERVALMDLYYQAPGGNKKGGYFQNADNTLTNLSQALKSGNRAQAWFEIRYRSADAGKQGAGVIPRRYTDSQLFGLYVNDLQATQTEALQAYQVLSANRALIIEYEQRNGSDPYGSTALTPAGQIAAANQTYNLAGTGAEVQTLAEIFEPAAQEEVQVLNGFYSNVLPAIQINDTGDASSSGWDIRAVDFYATSPTNQTVDADDAPGSATSDASANHILLGSETGDRLIGGRGSDILVAQGGNETLQAGAGADTLIASSGNDTLRLGGSSDVLDFLFPGTSGYTETVVENNGAAVGQIDIGGSQIGLDLSSTGSDTWTDQNGNTYQFLTDPSSSPAGYFPATNGSDVGELKIVLGGLAGGNEIDIWGFNLSQAENSDLGFLGIALPPTVSLNAGSTDGVDPPAPDFTAGTTQSYTASLDAPTVSPETITVTLTGVPSSDFGLVSGTSVIPLNADGTFTVTIPAGQTSVSFSLANTGDVGSAADLQLVASMSNPSDPSGQVLSSTPLMQSYVEPSQDPFFEPVATQLYFTGPETVAGGEVVSDYADMLSPGDTPVSSVGNAGNYIDLSGGANESVDGGAGSDTVFAQLGWRENGNGGVDVINGHGGGDIIDVDNTFSQQGDASVRIYANSEETLSQAAEDAANETASGKQGDLISVAVNDATIVGGAGNDLIMTSANGVIIAGPGDDTIIGGAIASITGSAAGATWSSSYSLSSNSDLSVSFGGNVVPENATGATLIGGGPVGTSNDTIFGGSGNDLITLSDGNNEVHLGAGNSTVYAGLGSNTITGGAGNDCILGGGGDAYIAAGTGDDDIAGFKGNNTILGGSGADTIFAGGDDSNWATEETGSNYVEAGSGNALIYGSGGNDTLIGGAGKDTIQAGDGSESVVAGSGDTSINGGSGADTLVAGSGADTIFGSTGSTTIYGGTGADQLYGQGGTDVIYAGDGGTSQVATSVTAGSGDTTIYGGDGVDEIWGGSGNDVIYAGDGGTAGAATQIVAGTGNSTIYGGDGVDHIFGGSGADVLYAGDGGTDGDSTYVTAGTGVSTLYGGAGVSVLTDSVGGGDVLEAGSGTTNLIGVGQDTLIAGSGSDYLSGGPDSTYVFGSNTGIEMAPGSWTAG